MQVTQEAHTGYKAKLWKIVRENGKETKTQVNSSTYSASPRYVVRGSMKEPKKTEKPAATRKPEATRQPAKRSTTRTVPQNTQAPVATQAPAVPDGQGAGTVPVP